MPVPQPVRLPFRLKDIDPADELGLDKDQAKAETQELRQRVRELQEMLYANGRSALLVVFQGMDASGKDGATRSLLEYVDPTGVEVTSFKTPSREEDAHDFLWRIHRAVPRYGNIGVFNRSHYEEVLIDRALGWEPESVWRPRYAMINAFEDILARNGYAVLKFFLHISKQEQKRRIERRLSDATKVWKFDPGDLKMREHWQDYMLAYEDAINACSTPQAPWYVVPADRKWVRDWFVTKVVVQRLEALKLRWPSARFDATKVSL